MANQSVTARDKLKLKWVMSAGGIVYLLGCLSLLLLLLPDITLYPRNFPDFYSVNFHLWEVYASFLADSVGNVVFRLILCLIPLTAFVQYLLYGHKLRYGTLFLSLSILTVPVSLLWTTFEMLFNTLSYSITFTSNLKLSSYDYRLLAAFLLALLATGCFAAGAAVLLVHPKIGKILTILCLIPGSVILLIACLCHQYQNVSWFLETMNSSVHSLVQLGAVLSLLLLELLIIVTLLVNRLPAMFGKQAQTADV